MSSSRSSNLSGIPHIMPSPPNIPWSSASMPWTITPSVTVNGVMEFTAAHQLPSFTTKKQEISTHKRKSTDIVPLPTKQLITEEKMAAHLNGLHISSDYVSHNTATNIDDPSGGGRSGFNDVAMDSDIDPEYTIPMSSKELEEKLKSAHRITICEQIRKIDQEDSIIPKALLARVEKPCTALVLWRPPQKLTDLVEKTTTPTTTTRKSVNNFNADDIEDEDSDNNNSSSLDLNCTMETDMM